MAKKRLVKKTDKKRTLVMFSGGIDSTAALWHVLHNPDQYGEVMVHHIHIKNLEARWRAEAMAIKQILEYMKKHVDHPFSYTESTIALPHFGKKFIYDVEIISFISGYMTSRDDSITKVVIAATATDFELGVTESVMRAKRVHNAFHPEEEDHSARIKEYPQKDLFKHEVYKTIPEDLAILTWSCRTPHYADGKPIECGRCKTCKKETSTIKRKKAPGKRSYL